RWAHQRFRMSVIRGFCGIKNDHTIKNRPYVNFTVLNLTVPQLQIATVFFFPLGIKIQNNIKQSIQFGKRMIIEIDMNAQSPTSSNTGQTASNKIRVGNEPGNPRQGFQKAQKMPGVKRFQGSLKRLRQAIDIFSRLLDLKGRVKLVP